MTLPLIGPEQDFALWAALIGLAAFGFWCERFHWGRKYSGVMLLMTAAIVLANLRILPTAAPVYDLTWDYLVPIAIPLLLFKANLGKILRETGPMLIAFLIGSVTVVIGVIAGTWLLDLGAAEPQLAGIFTGTYIGGSLNFAAVAEATGFRESSMLTAAVAADNVATNLHFLLIIFLPGVGWISRRFASKHIEDAAPVDMSVDLGRHTVTNLDLAGLLMSLATAFAIAAIGTWVATIAGAPQFSILAITVLAVLFGSLLPNQVAKLSGYDEAGNALMFIFLAGIGATCDIWLLVQMAPILFVFAAIIITVHMTLLLAIGKLFKLDIAEMLMASAMCISGPSAAPALGAALGWRTLIIPAVLLGCLGYVIGSFAGLAVVAWLQ